MNSKIDWFREVLDMEPGSKVFFPLAKLLVEDGDLKEAVKTLRHGLEKNPDHLEAKLLLVDVLYTCGEREDAGRESAAVSDLLQRYPGFWRTWASESTAGSPDMAAALEYLAGRFGGKSVSWSDIIRMGVANMFGDESAAPAETTQPDTGEAAEVVEEGAFLRGGTDATPDMGDVSIEQAHLKKVLPDDAEEEAADDVVDNVREELGDELIDKEDVDTAAQEASASAAEDTEAYTEEVADLPADALDGADFFAEAETAEADDESEETPDFLSDDDDEDLDLVEEHADLDPSALDLSDDDLSDDDVSYLTESLDDLEEAAEDADDAMEAAAESVEDAPELEEDSLPQAPPLMAESDDTEVRTKTMADLLAQQGDLKGAMEIYEELIEKADGSEREALVEAADKLRGNAGEAAAEAAEAKSAEQKEIPGRKKIMSTLENLAARLESRARS